MSPSKWGEDERKSTIRPMRSTSAISMLSEGDVSVFARMQQPQLRHICPSGPITSPSDCLAR
ncbi:hypothetical protein BBK36DRAFT_1164074 [Trichoderma citrinoviride]|uniref:Uncharacterized protein n=1 Tax=Trichoderma citrinoviride TaxID=58853 RepID=A0A2T4AWG3_9HYPO|nr:hypothetical protein BBK36DRAFT_1164074 [Trichoderma citrinoviride]PTB61395.1 hypothetical protein BBK36DRAFT_1164074 [Trichoderma citrinoviride]